MKTEKQFFDEAISLELYMDNMEKHKEHSFKIYEQFEVPQDDEFIALLKEKKPNILVITEDWCGDAMINNPVLRRIAEAAELDVRAVYRDVDTDLIDRHLTNGGRSIPIYLFLDENGEVEAKWGPRAEVIQGYVMELRKDLPPVDAADYKEKYQVFMEQISAEYTSKPENWLTIYEDIRKKWLPILQKQA